MIINSGAPSLSMAARKFNRRSLLLTAAAAGAASGLGVTPAQAAMLDNKATLTRARLDELAAVSYGVFNENAVLPAFDAKKFGAAHDVDLHRITTFTQVPETGETVKISGLLAVPAGVTGPMPVVSWQHGTTFSFVQVPSTLGLAAAPGYTLTENVDSQETLFNIHRFAANGYAVIAADYLGKGPYRGNRQESYAVKDASTRTSLDILDAGLQGMRQLDLEPTELFLNGWSQGGLNTQWLHQALQAAGVPVRASAAASPFNDLSECFGFWAGDDIFRNPSAAPYPARPLWLTIALAIVLASYETYYRIDGLLHAMVRPEYLGVTEKFLGDYDLNIAVTNAPLPEGLLIEGYASQFTSKACSRFLQQLAANRASFWDYSNPIRLYYGLADQALHPVMAQRAVTGGGPLMEGVAIGNASHRSTFLASLYGSPDTLQGKSNIPDWFDSLRAG